MAGHGGGDPVRVVVAALAGNAAIAITKFVAAYFSGSAAMLAEGVHSVADSANQALLLVGMRLAAKKDPVRYPLGRAKEVYFWAFVVALVLFSLGGVFAIYEGIHKLLEAKHDAHHTTTGHVLSVVVLLISLVMEAGSFSVAYREFSKQRGAKSLDEALFHGKDPTIPVVLLEDTGALVGLVLALAAVLLSWITGSPIPDAIGSIAIGILLCFIGVSLAADTKSLLIGEGVTPEVRARALQLVSETPGVEAVGQLLTYHLGPSSVILALKVRFPRGATVETIEATTEAIEERVREALPEMRKIFVEADSHYDPAQDPEQQPG